MRSLVTLNTPAEGLSQLTLLFRKPRLHFDYTHHSHLSHPSLQKHRLVDGLLWSYCCHSGFWESSDPAPALPQTHSATLTFNFNHSLFPPLTCTQNHRITDTHSTHSDTFTYGYIPNSWHSHLVTLRVLHPHLITITPSHSLLSYTTSAAHVPPHSIMITCD